MPSATLVNLTGFSFAFLADDGGINLESLTEKFMVKKILVPNSGGQTRGKVFYDPSIDVTESGEVAGSGGLMAATLGAVVTLNNLVFGFGITSGGVYVEDVTLTRGREKLQTLSLHGEVHPLVA